MGGEGRDRWFGDDVEVGPESVVREEEESLVTELG